MGQFQKLSIETDKKNSLLSFNTVALATPNLEKFDSRVSDNLTKEISGGMQTAVLNFN